MDRYVCLKKSDVVIPDGDIESSTDEDEGEEDDDDDDTDAGDELDDEAETETLVDFDMDALDKDDAIPRKAINSIPEVPDEESLAVSKVLPTSKDQIEDQVRKQN